MIRGTTPTYNIKITGADVTAFEKIYVTFKQGTIQFDVTPKVVDSSTVSVTLTQAQTLSFSAVNKVMMQIRAVNSLGVAVASFNKELSVYDILKDGEISVI
jgi:ABC-type antimicrobial peptide transport system permease subunit